MDYTIRLMKPEEYNFAYTQKQEIMDDSGIVNPQSSISPARKPLKPQSPGITETTLWTMLRCRML